MSDVERLLAAFDSGDLLRPTSDVPSLVDLATAIGAVMGSNGATPCESSLGIVDMMDDAKHVVLVAVDGLGMNGVDSLGSDAFIPRHLKMQLHSVFPTSTPVAFTSLATGRWPNEHGVIGWDTYLPEASCVSTIIHYVRRSDGKKLSALGVSGTDAYPVRSAAGGYEGNPLSLLPTDIVNSEFSNYVAGGTAQRGYESLSQAMDTVAERLALADAPTFTYLYTPVVDQVAHEFGASHEKTLATARSVDREVERLVGALPERVAVVLTADHGLLDADEQLTRRIEPGDRLLDCLADEPWGDKRATNFQVRDGHEAAFVELFKERFGDLFYLMEMVEVEELGLYGPGELSPFARRRLGNYLAVSAGPDILRYPYRTDKPEKRMVSHHSGLSPSEMLVPLVVIRK